jgi:hypothetical protein
MLYHFELMMAGWVLLSTMAIGAIWLYIKRRRERAGSIEANTPESEEGGAAGSEETP